MGVFLNQIFSAILRIYLTYFTHYTIYTFYIQLKENKEIIMCLISHCWDRREGNWPLLWLLLCVPRVATNVLFHPRFGIETAKAFQEAEGCNIHLINGPISSKLKLVLQNKSYSQVFWHQCIAMWLRKVQWPSREEYCFSWREKETILWSLLLSNTNWRGLEWAMSHDTDSVLIGPKQNYSGFWFRRNMWNQILSEIPPSE